MWIRVAIIQWTMCPEWTVARKGNNKGAKIHHACFGRHLINPTYFPKGSSRAKHGSGGKRARSAGSASPFSETEEADADVDGV